MIDPEREAFYRLIFIGKANVGKTSILKRFIDGQFNAHELHTNIASHSEHRIPVDGKEVSLQIWDTAGQEKFTGLSAIYFRNADAVILVFAMTDSSSFDDLQFWFATAAQFESNLLFYVVGNKVDLDSEIVVDRADAQKFGVEHEAPLFLTSALENIGIHHLFRQVAQDLLARSLPPKAVQSEAADLEPPPPRACC